MPRSNTTGNDRKRNVVESFSYPIEDVSALNKLEEIARRERRSKSFMIMEAIKEYAKAHAEGNDQYTLDSEALAYPTPWKAGWSKEMLDSLSPAELQEMRKLLKEKLVLIDSRIAALEPSRPQKHLENCPYCGKPMLFGFDAHYYSNYECRQKARKDGRYNGPPFNEVDPTLTQIRG